MLKEFRLSRPSWSSFFKMWRALICSLTMKCFDFTSEAKGSSSLHRWLSLWGSFVGQRHAVQQANHCSDLRGDLPTMWYAALAFLRVCGKPGGWFCLGEMRVGAMTYLTNRQNIITGHHPWNVSSVGCKIQFMGRAMFFSITRFIYFFLSVTLTGASAPLLF